MSCGRIAPKHEFFRVVRVCSSQELQLNQGMGRSAYLCPQESCLQTAQKKNRLSRSLKTQVPQDFYQLLWHALCVLDSTSCS
nr:YlxR family protein [Leptolyngbya sp. 'hensonii']